MELGKWLVVVGLMANIIGTFLVGWVAPQHSVPIVSSAGPATRATDVGVPAHKYGLGASRVRVRAPAGGYCPVDVSLTHVFAHSGHLTRYQMLASPRRLAPPFSTLSDSVGERPSASSAC